MLVLLRVCVSILWNSKVELSTTIKRVFVVAMEGSQNTIGVTQIVSDVIICNRHEDNHNNKNEAMGG